MEKKFVISNIAVQLTLLFLLLGSTPLRAETTYPTTIMLTQIDGAEKERLRLAQGHKKFDRQPTGFYADSGKKVVVSVTVITPAADSALPVLTIGTLGFNINGRTYKDYPLTAGKNTVTATNSGLIYLSYITTKSKAPVGRAQVVFDNASEHVRAPRYVYGVTAQTEFEAMLSSCQTPDVVYHSDYVVVVATRENALKYKDQREKWMDDLHTLLEKEDEISGLDNADPKPVHHRLKAGAVRFLLTNNTSASPHASSAGYTGYPPASVSRYLTPFTTCSGGSCNNSWMLGHEIGHQHQQPAYQIDLSTESTVNIYSYVVERNMQGSSYNRTSAARWQQARSTYLSLPVEERVYNMSSDELEKLLGFNRDELRFMVWEQLFLIFGDDFYKRLHRITREEQVTGGSEQDRRLYLIWKASQLTGYDLREFFNQWGIRVTDAACRDTLQARFDGALASSAITALPKPVDSLMAVTGQSRPAWTPLPLLGISSSKPGMSFLDRESWTIITSFAGAADGTVGGNKPEYIIDEDKTTAFCFVKPGKTYNNITVPADHVPSFTIDMKQRENISCFRYMHRTAGGNSEAMLRASKVSLYGKNAEADELTPIVENVEFTVSRNEEQVSFSPVTYRYVQLRYIDWDKTAGSTIQVAEFDLSPAPDEEEPIAPPVDSTPAEQPNGIWGSAAPEEAPYILYPNPVKAGSPFCIGAEASGKKVERNTVRIYDACGRKIRERVAFATPIVDVLHASGIFFVSVESALGRKVFKLVVRD